MNFLLVFLLFHLSSAYIKLPLGSPFSIKNRELEKKIIVDLPPEDLVLINKIRGIYGVIGPDVDVKNINNLYELLLGDGIIQGVFFDKGELTFIKNYVKTEKIVYEESCGRVLQNNIIRLLFFVFNKMNLLPNIFGLANTALVTVGNKHYALYERDYPYEIKFNLSEKSIQTVGKRVIKGIEHFSAHPSVRGNEVETIDYNILKRTVSFYRLVQETELVRAEFLEHTDRMDENLVLQKAIEIPMNYLPIVHDFISTRYNYIVLDSPLDIKMSNLHNKAMPVSLKIGEPTFFHIVNKITGRVRTIKSNESFFIFHYAQIQEDENRIMIYAPVYDDIDFSELNIQGRYRRLTIDKKSDKVIIEKTEELENLDMDFPVRYEDKVVFRNMKDRICEGFVICRDLEIVKKIYLENRFVYGEPRVIYVDGIPYLIGFISDLEETPQGYIILINLRDYKQIEIPIGEPIKYGFHSFFLP